jgi:hypothetical protein
LISRLSTATGLDRFVHALAVKEAVIEHRNTAGRSSVIVPF